MSAVIDPQPMPAGRCVLGVGPLERVIAYTDGRAITLETFHAQVRALAVQLPAGRYAVNLCEDRYRFMLAFCAVASRGQISLLPPSRATAVVHEVMVRQPATYAIGDRALDVKLPHYWQIPERLAQCDGPIPEVADDVIVAMAFTSGTTGAPKAFAKTMGQFRASTAQLVATMVDLWQGHRPGLVATVPPQHMFGLEQSVMVPLMTQATVHGGRPFFPQDVANALAQMPSPRMLITTPMHLRALVESNVSLPAIAGCVSATAPLDQALAALAEARFGGQVREIFGSTETCIFATRRTAHATAWTPLPGVSVQPQPDGTLIGAPHLQQPVMLADLMEVRADGCFQLRGRQADLLEIAGKRASLGDLTRRLLAVPGVCDGVIVQIDNPGKVRRIAALVVAMGLSEGDVLSSLRETMDPVFLPRRIRLVDSLPRNENGKLPRADVLQLLGEA